MMLSRVKLMVLGVSGAGKTGAVVSLAAAGYRVYIFDFEDGAPIIKNIVRDKYPKLTISDNDNPEIADINILKLSNDFVSVGFEPRREKNGWEKHKQALANWKKKRAVGDPYWLYTLGPKDVIVYDTASGWCDLVYDYVLNLNSRTDPIQKDYKQMQDQMDFYCRLLASDSCKANWIMNAHIANFREGGTSEDKRDAQGNVQRIQIGGVDVGFPKTTGQTLSKSIGRHFNDTLFLTMEPGMKGDKHIFTTQPDGIVRVKTSSPFSVKKSYPIETGLADYFKDVRGE